MTEGSISTPDLLRLADSTGEVREFRSPEVRVGRDPACEWCIRGTGSVSAVHARLTFRDRGWTLEDASSRNGTFVGDRRLAFDESVPLRAGMSFRLAAAGPVFRVVSIGAGVADATLLESPSPDATIVESSLDAAATLLVVPPSADALPGSTAGTKSISRPGAMTARERAMADYSPAPSAPPAPEPPLAARTSAPDWGDPAPPPAPRVFAVFQSPDTTQHFALTGTRARIGRAPECEFRLSVTDAQVLSRVHAELKVEGSAVIVSDAGSSFGTFVNAGQLTAPRQIAAGDIITLGATGPKLVAMEVNGVRAPENVLVAAQASGAAALPTAVANAPAKGMTLFVKRLAEDAARASTRRLRLLLLGSVGVFSIALIAVQLLSESRARETENELARQRQEAQRARQESRNLSATASKEAARLQSELRRALAASAPRATVDSLQRSLESAMLRTGAMEASLSRAGTTLRSQLAATDSLRRRAEDNLARVRADLTRAQLDPRNRVVIDSLTRAADDAQRQLTGYDAQFRTLQSVTIAGAAETDQRAIGMVAAHRGNRVSRSSGFVISASGFFLSARDALGVDQSAPDSLVVTFGDPARRWVANVASVSRAKSLDVVVLKLRDYEGPFLRRLDWAGTRGAVNEPAAIIGFQGNDGGAASVSAAIVSRSAPDRMRLEVFGAASMTGSPVFGANGEVIGILQLALPKDGVAYAARLYRIGPLLPAAAQAELGVRQ